MPRRLVSTAAAARHYAVSDRTIRNYIGRGYVTGYRVQGKRGVLIDLDESDRVMAQMPGSRARASKKAYGPNARIVVISQPVVVSGDDQ
ncbi:hypothetical protein ACT17Q_12690 [Cellulomonas sp. CW35]|uniref:hypothetical protein n=1 Tax=Cellulomonas sp. CW35 TaxID=3458249 RepID=UPI004033823B